MAVVVSGVTWDTRADTSSIPHQLRVCLLFHRHWHLGCHGLQRPGCCLWYAKSGTGTAAVTVMGPELLMKSIIPVVMAGIIAIYSLVVAVLVASSLNEGIDLYRSSSSWVLA